MLARILVVLADDFHDFPQSLQTGEISKWITNKFDAQVTVHRDKFL